MTSSRSFPLLAAITMLVITILACSLFSPATTAAPPVETPIPALPTSTTEPTATTVPAVPTSTPDMEATAQFDKWKSELEQFSAGRGVDTSGGKFTSYEDFQEEWAQMGWYQWWPIDDLNGDFMFGANFEWETSANTPEISGCGIVFGLQENGDHYSVFLDKSRILFMMMRGSNNYVVGKTSGSGRANFSLPAETDFQVFVEGKTAHVSVGSELTKYTLSQDQTTHGELALSVLSGTNKGYGTRCKMTDIHVWTP